jgi:hypothetical protein
MNEIPYGYCHCGCGSKTRISERNDTGAGHVKGQPLRFVPGHMGKETRSNIRKGCQLSKETRKRIKDAMANTPCDGADNHNWKGGKTTHMGYSTIMVPTHPKANGSGYVPEHVLIAEKALGHSLPPNAIVHHYPKNPSNQLVICPDMAYHMLLHVRQRAFNACGHANWRKCKICKQYDEPSNLFIRPYAVYHRTCINEYVSKRHLENPEPNKSIPNTAPRSWSS